jgi:hypothetical protein
MMAGWWWRLVLLPTAVLALFQEDAGVIDWCCCP